MKVRRRFSTKLLLSFCLIYLCASIAEGELAPRFFMTAPEAKLEYAAKSGRVIDASTGKGIPGIMVISYGGYYKKINKFSLVNLVLFSVAPIHIPGSGGRNTLYVSATRTDEQGKYLFPDTREEVWRGIDGEARVYKAWNLEPAWTIKPVAFGYVSTEISDKTHTTAPDKDSGEFAVGDLTMSRTPTGVTGLEEDARTGEIAMALLAERFHSTANEQESLSKWRLELSAEAYAYFQSLTCALPDTQSVNKDTVVSMLRTLPQGYALLKELNPNWEAMDHGAIKEDIAGERARLAVDAKEAEKLDKPEYTARAVCQAITK